MLRYSARRNLRFGLTLYHSKNFSLHQVSEKRGGIKLSKVENKCSLKAGHHLANNFSSGLFEFFLLYLFIGPSRGVMVSVLAFSVEGHVFDPRLGQTKGIKLVFAASPQFGVRLSTGPPRFIKKCLGKLGFSQLYIWN